MFKRKGPISDLHEEYLYNIIGLKDMAAKKKKLSKLQKNINNPFSSYWRRRTDILWSDLVRGAHERTCELCGDSGKTNAHHLLPKEKYHLFKYNLRNGICLCAFKCHKMIAHKNPIFFLSWLEKNKPDQYSWAMDNCKKLNKDKINFKQAK